MRIVSGLATVLSLLLIASVVHAQQQIDPSRVDPQNWFKQACPKCGVNGYVDYPPSGSTLHRSNIILAGWGFECVTGATVDRVDVWYESDESGYWLPLKQADYALIAGTIGRPDVVGAFAPSCPNVPANSGWWLQVTNPPPAGARRVLIQIRSGPYHADLVRTYNFTD